MKYFVINRSNAQIPVTIVGPNGEKDSVFIQPKSKAKIKEGWSVDKEFLALNKHVQMVDSNPAKPAPTTTPQPEVKKLSK